MSDNSMLRFIALLLLGIVAGLLSGAYDKQHGGYAGLVVAALFVLIVVYILHRRRLLDK